MKFDKCKMSCIHHPNIMQNHFTALKSPCALPFLAYIPVNTIILTSKTNLSVPVQDSNAGGSWTHFISHIHQIYSYIWNNSHWKKTQTSWATPTPWASEQNPHRSRHERKLKHNLTMNSPTQSHPQMGGNSQTGASPWGARILNLHLTPGILRPAPEK